VTERSQRGACRPHADGPGLRARAPADGRPWCVERSRLRGRKNL